MFRLDAFEFTCLIASHRILQNFRKVFNFQMERERESVILAYAVYKEVDYCLVNDLLNFLSSNFSSHIFASGMMSRSKYNKN